MVYAWREIELKAKGPDVSRPSCLSYIWLVDSYFCFQQLIFSLISKQMKTLNDYVFSDF